MAIFITGGSSSNGSADIADAVYQAALQSGRQSRGMISSSDTGAGMVYTYMTASSFVAAAESPANS